MAAAKIAGASPLLLSVLLSLLVFSTVASSNNYSLVVGQSTSLHLTPSLLVEKSPAFKPGTKLLCERVDIMGLLRLKNIRKFAHSVKVNVSYVLPSSRPPNVHICFHRNASLGVGMCPQGPWGKISKDSWARTMSPFDHKLLDLCISGSSSAALKLSIDEDFSYSRIMYLIFGTALMTIAWALSKSLIFYYGSAMALGVILVILMILFQGMKLLPTGRKNSLAMFLYASMLGFGAIIFRDVPRLVLHSFFGEIGEEYIPLIIFTILFLALAGAWLGFWAVRKLVLADDGSIDEGVSNFFAWSIWIIGAVMIFQSSVDPLLSAVNLISGILVSVVLRNISLIMLLLYLYEFAQKSLLHLYESALEVLLHLYEYALELLLHFGNFFRKGESKHRRSRKPESHTAERSISDSDPFYSTFHNTPERRRFSKEEWEKFTKETTKNALEGLVSSPDFNRWAVAHADRITLTPTKDSAKQPKRWLPWS
ncbi:Nuclear envelope integral membrane protein 1 [Heracleum sosnowskyi]|uniref:Nuclear envelope integral membrane protein 1 n=1 Tax=Heracleum sosnowskyi TaxID=360622 RepID=A0AAD8HCS7_9APIA|nr:Nuclear envelope integral membrane protein 1 [Heracleum sosnowskyi]